MKGCFMKKQGFEGPVFSLVRRDAFTLRCVVLNNSQSPLKIHLLFHTALLHLTEKPQKSRKKWYICASFCMICSSSFFVHIDTPPVASAVIITKTLAFHNPIYGVLSLLFTCYSRCPAPCCKVSGPLPSGNFSIGWMRYSWRPAMP